jgi:hypothetical protein
MARRREDIFAPSERLIQEGVIEHWRLLGLPGTLVAAIPNARSFGQAGLTKGLFDLIVMSPTLGDRTGWLELKADHGVPSKDQIDIQALMTRLGIPHAVAIGRDEPIRVLERWGAVKRQAFEPQPRSAKAEAAL